LAGGDRRPDGPLAEARGGVPHHAESRAADAVVTAQRPEAAPLRAAVGSAAGAGSSSSTAMSMVNVVPAPVALSTAIVPPWASMNDLQIARPSPAPPLSRDRALST